MNIPNKVKVGGLTYKVEILEELDSCVGKTTYEDLDIKIKKAEEDFMNLTFWHEILHTINGELRETDIEFLAMSLYQVFKDNPEIFQGGVKNGRKKQGGK